MKLKFRGPDAFACDGTLTGLPAPAAQTPDGCKAGGFVLGCQAWTFKKFSVLEAIEKTAAAGGMAIEFYPGQKLSPEGPATTFDHNATDETIAIVRAKLRKSGIRPVNYGVVKISKDEAAARKVFEFAKKLSLYGLTTESLAAIDTLERLAREYDVCVGFHNHPRRRFNPFYKSWDPNHILSVVQDRDPRIGAAADTGHWVRSGLDPLACLKILHGRLISVHLKDLNKKSRTAHDVPCGTGVANLTAVLDELKRQGFTGNISIEYENHWNDNLAEVAQSVDFVRRHGTARPEN